MSGEAWTRDEIDDCLTALIAYDGNATAAIRYLEAQGMRHPSATTLHAWARTRHWERYEELREKVAAGREGTLANNYLDAAAYATDGIKLAITKSIERLEDGKDEDPARTAANLARVAQSATDKRLSLQGRPTQIVENRNLDEILRSLAAKKIIQIPEAVEATDVER